MDFSLPNPRLWLLLAGAAGMVALSAPAQASRREGQSILFSSPDNDEVATNVPSLSAKPPVLSGFAAAVQAPVFNFQPVPQTAPLPMPSAPMVSAAGAAELQRQLDERKNWTMLTPEEILGLPTPEKMLGLPERDDAGQPKNETVAERFFERQESQHNASTNNNAAGNSTAQWNLSDSQPRPFNPASSIPANNYPGNTTLMDQFLNGKSDNNSAATSQNPDLNWPKLFSSSATPATPTPEQQAAAAEFQKLLEPRSSAPAAADASPGDTIFSTLKNPSVPDPVLGQPTVVPIGLSLTPLSSGISTPVGVTPLPALSGQTTKPATPAAPEWKPQLPPWMLSTPQLGVVPQRKF
jgi:hypothetical protein